MPEPKLGLGGDCDNGSLCRREFRLAIRRLGSIRQNLNSMSESAVVDLSTEWQV